MSWHFVLGVAVFAFAVAASSAEDKVRTIPLDLVYSTSTQKGLRAMSRSFTGKDGQKKFAEPYGYALEQIYLQTQGLGPSNVFLVRGQDIQQAVTATMLVLTGGRSADQPTGEGPGKDWAVAYLGVSGSTPRPGRFSPPPLRARRFALATRKAWRRPRTCTSTFSGFRWAGCDQEPIRWSCSTPQARR